MPRWPFAFLFLFGFAILGPSTGLTQDKKWAPISIEYHGQSFFILTTSKDTRIAFDPHTIEQYGRNEVLPKVDVICISHNHNDHTRTVAFDDYKKTKVLRGLKSESLKADWAVVDETVKDAKIRTVGVYHDEQEGLLRGKNAIFIVEVDGWKVAHLGDLGHLLTPAQLKRIGKVDVIMIPVGGIYTINGAEAKKVVDQLKPKEYIFPMHFGTAFFDYTLTPKEFYDDVEKRRIAISDDNSLTLDRNPDRPRPLIVQLNHEPKKKK
jgi:L-ascorbate metabolism protein UlaG (beta-lactamase superfamily)